MGESLLNWVLNRLSFVSKHKHDKQLEAYKAQLVRDGGTRAVVQEAYSRLSKYESSVASYVSELSSSPVEKLRQAVDEASHGFWEYYRTEQIRMPKRLADHFCVVHRRLGRSAKDFRSLVDRKDHVNHAAWTRIAKEMEKEVVPLCRSFEEEVRKYLDTSGEPH
jgi:hypothetical protein